MFSVGNESVSVNLKKKIEGQEKRLFSKKHIFFKIERKCRFTDTGSATTENTIIQKKFLVFPMAVAVVSLNQTKEKTREKKALLQKTHFVRIVQKSGFTDTTMTPV